MTTACAPAVFVPAALTPVSRLRLTRRGRVVFTTLAAVPLVIGAVSFAVNGGAAGAADSATGIDLMSYTTDSGIVTTLAYSPTDVGSARFVTVEPGQTLWDLAEEISPAADPRDVVADIKRLNALSVETLQPGQRLEIPADT
ncbi:LysM peptidoglycan-binding domain-containing protein [Cryobacterium suzukii]|uniref:LysM peptidoglycan-binding domain-containing protein n=1 Tax=Cryobacterium suzukii TaxID=1259198 RepID=A0A4R9ACZ0_9MICO|nr:LysM peptidoglycan-binding domain-containing protein [Cryobacterium suzukii]TFD58703.1 LysM peptidoglycan-binding domain-containing protein [Cryobacterium suzukii]